MKHYADRIKTWLGSSRFFVWTIAFFVFESIWIALSADYPQAFDEDYHFGLIKTYSHYWLPFLSHQPPGADAYGAVARDPSYLYHYLMSFPYRLVSLIIHSQTGQVIAMRLIDIALFALGLILFKKVLRRAKISAALANISIFLFILIPIVPQLAAHVNYDDLVFPLTAGMCLLTYRLYDEIKNHHISLATIVFFLALGLLGTQVKYAFAPIFAGAFVFILISIIRTYHRRAPHEFAKMIRTSWREQSKIYRLLLGILLVIGIGLFAQRDGYNLVRYHTFTPDCSQIVSVKSCETYSPWKADFERHQRVLKSPTPVKYENPVSYLGSWAYWMWYRLFFAINGAAHGYKNYPPLPLPAAAAFIIGILGIAAVIFWRKRIFKGNPYLVFFSLVVGFYVVALWIDGYAQYKYTDVLVTMNGRYLLPIMLLAVAIVGRGFSLALRRRPVRKAAFAMLAAVLFLEGGGFLTFLSRSDSTWDWPDSVVIKVNDTARKITRPVLIVGSKYYHTKRWFFN